MSFNNLILLLLICSLGCKNTKSELKTDSKKVSPSADGTFTSTLKKADLGIYASFLLDWSNGFTVEEPVDSLTGQIFKWETLKDRESFYGWRDPSLRFAFSSRLTFEALNGLVGTSSSAQHKYGRYLATLSSRARTVFDSWYKEIALGTAAAEVERRVKTAKNGMEEILSGMQGDFSSLVNWIDEQSATSDRVPLKRPKTLRELTEYSDELIEWSNQFLMGKPDGHSWKDLRNRTSYYAWNDRCRQLALSSLLLFDNLRILVKGIDKVPPGYLQYLETLALKAKTVFDSWNLDIPSAAPAPITTKAKAKMEDLLGELQGKYSEVHVWLADNLSTPN